MRASAGIIRLDSWDSAVKLPRFTFPNYKINPGYAYVPKCLEHAPYTIIQPIIIR